MTFYNGRYQTFEKHIHSIGVPRFLQWRGFPGDRSRFSERGPSQGPGDFVIQKLKQLVKLLMYN